MDREVFEALKSIRALNRKFVSAIHEMNDRIKKIEKWVDEQDWQTLDVWLDMD